MAVVVTNAGADFADYTGQIVAYGGRKAAGAGGAGTVYLRTAGQGLEEGTLVVGRTGESLRMITDAVSRTTVLAETIAGSMKEQAARTAAVDKAIHDIAAVVEENAASAEETAAAAQEQTACMQEVSSSAQELSDMAQNLEDSVHSLKVD